MNRIDRLQAILIQIQSKKIVTAKEIADRFDISIRTVYRDIRALEEAGVPIGAETGVGYFLDENYNLPPVMFTPEEASSLLMAGKLIPHMIDKKVEKAFQDALIKIKAVLKTEQKESLEKLENAMKVYPGLVEPPHQDSIYLQDIQQALISQSVLKIEYFAQYKQENSIRNVEPIGLLYYALNWHLIAYCRLRKQYRDFRLDRIQSLEVTNEIYGKDLDKAFEEYLNREKEKIAFHEISVKCSKDFHHHIHQSKYWYGLISETHKNEFIKMNFLNPDLSGFAKWIITLGVGVEVTAPKELKNEIVALVNNLQKKYL